MNIRISSNDYILKTFLTHKLYADTNIFLLNSWEKCREIIFPRLAQCNRKLIVLGSVMAELRKLASTTDKLAVACRAQKAIHDINSLVNQKLIKIEGDEASFADHDFLSTFTTRRLSENIVLLSADKGLLEDVFRLNYSESVHSYRRILVWHQEPNGFINTRWAKRLNRNQAFFKESTEERYCATCGKPFYLSPSHKQFFLSKGLAIPTHCPDCRALIKKTAEQENTPNLASAFHKLVQAFKEQFATSNNI